MMPPNNVLFLCLPLLVVVFLLVHTAVAADDSNNNSSFCHHYKHVVVLVHGYLGSDKEQSYLKETLTNKTKTLNNDDDDDTPNNNNNNNNNTTTNCQRRHEFRIFLSKANVHDTTDGIIKGGQRLAREVANIIQEEEEEEEGMHSSSEQTILTLSMIGNSLGGLFSRYAIGELLLPQKSIKNNNNSNNFLPLIFATTSSPHLGVTNNTFVPLPRWAEELVGYAMAQSGKDMFWIDDDDDDGKEGKGGGGGVIADMCSLSHRFLQGLQQFQKRIAVANAYNTDFLVSVSSGAFLSKDSESIHFNLENSENKTTTNANDDNNNDNATRPLRLMNNEHVVLQVETTAQSVVPSSSSNNRLTTTTTTKTTAESQLTCTNNLDQLGWHKIFLDTRRALPNWMSFDHDPVPSQPTYTSRELKDRFARYGTVFPIAHPLNMANSKTEWYSLLTSEGRPIMDALADLLIHDMIDLSEAKVLSSEEEEAKETAREDFSENSNIPQEEL